MYCEITVTHGKEIDQGLLKPFIVEAFKNPLDLKCAYARSAIYKNKTPASSVCALELESDCFVIFRKVAGIRSSMFHLEGNHSQVPVTTLLQAVQKFSRELITQLRSSKIGRAYKPRELTVKIFEDNGKDTGVAGNQVTIVSVFREKFGWKEVAAPTITFATALVLLWIGLDSKPLAVAGYTLGGVAFFMLADTLAECWLESRENRVESRLNR